ncbi:MAG: carboxypeptidase-like regulatory domain-containing protein [Bacteroidota bacterium]
MRAQSVMSGAFEDASLSAVLDEMEEAFGAKFSFDPDFVATQRIEKLKGEEQTLEWWLAEVTRRCEAEFVHVGRGSYAIRKGKKPVARWRGRVKDGETGEDLPGALLVVLGKDNGQPVAGVVANARGEFELPQPAVGSRVVVRYLGYRQDTVVVTKGGKLPTQIQLRSGALKAPVVVVTGRSELPISRGESGLSLNPRRLDALSVLGEPDVFRTLQWMPGVSSTEESSNGIYIRGGTPDQNLVLLDGVPIYNT